MEKDWKQKSYTITNPMNLQILIVQYFKVKYSVLTLSASVADIL